MVLSARMGICSEWAHLSYSDNPRGKLRKIWGQARSQGFSSVISLKPGDLVCQDKVPKYHSPEAREIGFLTALEAGNPRSRCCQGWF